MKSAYELAMERLDKSDPDASKPLTDEQKSALAEIDKVYDSRIAEKEVFLQGKLATAKADEKADIQEQLRREKERLNEERAHKKDRIRSGQ